MLAAADPALLEAYLALESRLSRPLGEYEAVLDELAAALAAGVHSDGGESTVARQSARGSARS